MSEVPTRNLTDRVRMRADKLILQWCIQKFVRALFGEDGKVLLGIAVCAAANASANSSTDSYS